MKALRVKLLEALGAPDHLLPRWSQAAEPFKMWSRESIENVLFEICNAQDEMVEAAEAAYNSWSGGEPIDADMRRLGAALGLKSSPV